MAGIVKKTCLVSRWKVLEWNYLQLCSNHNTPAASNHGPTTATYTPAQALKSLKKYRLYKTGILVQNRRNPELEKKARLEKLYVPLDKVKQEWMGPRGYGLAQLMNMGLHSHVYQDGFGMSFRPQGFLGVSYSSIHHVAWGSVIKAKHALTPPTVTVPPITSFGKWGRYATSPLVRGPEMNYVTLTLTNPDGHLLDGSQELLHWMVGNVPIEGRKRDVWTLPTEGHLLCPYLAPVPPSGTGLHRFIFTLYTHTHPLHIDRIQEGLASDNWLHQRTFSIARFLADNSVESGVVPFTFCYFQTLWDSSVRHTYKHILKYPEPVYDVEKRVSPRKLKQREVHAARQAHYTLL